MRTDNSIFKILIVDDQPKNIQVLGNILRKEHYNIEFAVNGAQAVERVNSENFDLLLLDIMMPVMDGIQACTEIRKTHSLHSLPIIFLTAKSQRTDITEGFNAGAQDYVIKPFDAKELISRVSTQLELKHYKEELISTNVQLNEKNRLLTASEKELKEAVETKDMFFSIIAHDIKTPFFILSAHSEILIKYIHDNHNFSTDSDLGKIAKNLNIVANNGKAMMNNLLQWARAQNGKLSYYPEEVNVHSLLTTVIQSTRPRASLKHININYLSTKSFIAYIDPHMIEVVLHNLINNAIKFTDEYGQIEIAIKEEKETVVVAISDSGVGIKEKEIENLFKIQKKTKTLGTNGEEGSGLGLLVCKEFVDLNKGEIKVESSEGLGSRFEVYLPKAKQAEKQG